MPVPQTYRVNPIDLQPNVAVGISLPFNTSNVFTSTYSTKDQVKYNLINFILTNKGERLFNPNFGSSIKEYLFESITGETEDSMKDTLSAELSTYFPEIIVTSIKIDSDPDSHFINLNVSYKMTLSGDKDTIDINFQT